MFNYGRVKIVNVEGIMYGDKHWDNGDEVSVISHTSMALLVESKKQVGTYVITEEEINCVEFIDWEIPDKLEDVYKEASVNVDMSSLKCGNEVKNKKTVVIRVKKEKEVLKKALLLEQDYFLASLYDAIQAKDAVGRKEYNAELTRIHEELEALK